MDSTSPPTRSEAITQSGSGPGGNCDVIDPRRCPILVVDDEEVVRMSLKELLGGEGYPVLVASNGEEALSLFKDTAVSMVITDVMMPGMTGLQLQEKLHSMDPSAPVLVITAYPTVERAVSAIQHGAVNFITKPFDIHCVLDTVVRTLRSRARLERNLKTLAYGRCTQTFAVPGTMDHVPGLVHYFLNRTILADAWPPALIFQIRLALDEILINAVKYGTLNNPDKRIHVTATIDSHTFDAVIEDDGPGFDAHSLPDPTTEESLLSMTETGRGVFLVRCYMDKVEYNAKGNSVHIVKYNAVND